MKYIQPEPKICEICNKTFNRDKKIALWHFKIKRTCSTKCYGKLRIKEQLGFKKGHISFSEKGRFTKGQTPWNKGLHVKCNNALAIYYKNNGNRPRAENHYNWKGGTTALRQRIQDTYLYRKWRKDCFERDNYTCQHCGKRGGFLHVDHIKQYSKIIKEYEIKTVEEAKQCMELWDILNGRTLCVECHRQTTTYGNKKT